MVLANKPKYQRAMKVPPIFKITLVLLVLILCPFLTSGQIVRFSGTYERISSNNESLSDKKCTIDEYKDRIIFRTETGQTLELHKLFDVSSEFADWAYCNNYSLDNAGFKQGLLGILERAWA